MRLRTPRLPVHGSPRSHSTGRPRRARRRAAAAFTLLEMIVSMVLLAVGVSGAVVAIGGTGSATSASRDLTVLALLAQRRLAEFEAEVAFNQMITEGVDEGDFGEDYPEYQWQQEVLATDTADLYQITIRVGHIMRDRERTFDLVTERLAPPPPTTETTGGDTTGGATGAPGGDGG